MPALARLHPAELTASFMEVTCVNVFGKSGGKLPVKNLETFFLSKEYSALFKVHSSLSKVRALSKVRVTGNQLPLPLRGWVMSPCGISLTLRKPTASHRQE